MNKGRTRIAPTPSGFLHVGNLYAFLHTAQRAKENGWSLRLRIDDLDRSRFRQAYLEDIFAVLATLGIRWEEGPSDAADFLAHYRQELRMPLYQSYLQQLRDAGWVYACSCSRSQLASHPHYPGTCRHKQLPLDDPNLPWRLRLPEDAAVQLLDLQGTAQTINLAGLLGDPVVLRKAEKGIRWPAYHLACVADDVLYQTTHIVRGQDLYESSLIQLFIAQCLRLTTFTQIRFEHHALLTTPDGRKLSKSAGDHKGRSLLEDYPSQEACLTLINRWPGINDAL